MNRNAGRMTIIIIALLILTVLPVGQAFSQGLTVQVHPTMGELPTGYIGNQYYGLLLAVPDIPPPVLPYDWSITAGALPPGLALQLVAAGDDATIVGIPTTEGVFFFTVGVSDTAGGSGSADFIITIERLFYEIIASSKAGGTISPSGTVNVTLTGVDQTFTITPGPGAWIHDVLVDGLSVGPVADYTFPSVDADHTIEAIFAKYRLDILGNFGGTVNGRLSTTASDINELGEIAGSSEAPGGYRHAFLWQDGVMTDLWEICEYQDPPVFVGDITGVSLNNQGTIVGYDSRPLRWDNLVCSRLSGSGYGGATAVNSSNVIVGDLSGRAVKWDSSWPLPIQLGYFPSDPPHNPGSYAYDINDQNQIVGSSNNHAGWYAAYWPLGTEASLTELENLSGGQQIARASGINDLGDMIAGKCNSANGHEACVWIDDGLGNWAVYGLGDLPGGPFNGGANDVNDAGEVIGQSYGEREWYVEPFVWTAEDGMVNLNDVSGAPEYFLITATAINNRGQIIGSADGPLLDKEAFLLTPDHDVDGIFADEDCDDREPAAYPGASEICDGIDNNCDGQTDEGFDVDGDTYTLCQNDCDDTDPAVNPGATEVCDGIDNNCDGQTDEGFNIDGDAYTTCNGDCDDTDPAVNPGATEVCDGIDNNCDQSVDEGFDIDGDTYKTCDGDCDDTDPAVNPGASEICDGIDNNCDGQADEGFDVDGDTYTSCQDDCDDTDPAVNPGASEVCDGIDNNCDLVVDEGFDADGDGFRTCDGDCDDGDAGINPLACDIKGDGIDQDCDGSDRVKGKPCEGGDTCSPTPGEEVFELTCTDGVDNDCDGLIDTADQDCPGGSCADHTARGACNDDPDCEWNRKQGICEDANAAPDCGTLDDQASCEDAGCNWNSKKQQCR